jgi:(S)-ureidoglycine aminohydrolase
MKVFSKFSTGLFLSIICVFSTKAQDVFPLMPSTVIYWDSLKVTSQNGRQRRMLLPKSTSTHLNLLSVHATTQEPGISPNPPHPNQDIDELLIIKEGKVKFTVGDNSKILEKGGVAVVMANEVQGIENIGDKPATYYVFRFQSKNKTDIERGKNGGGSVMINKAEIMVKKHNKGERRDYYNRATTQCEIFEMHTTALNAGLESHQPHIHVTEEALLITKGTISMVIDCKIFQAKAGDLVLLSSNVPHALINTSGEQCEYFAFTWK